MPEPNLVRSPCIPRPAVRVDFTDVVLQPEPPQDGPPVNVVGNPEPPGLAMNPNLGLVHEGLPSPMVEEAIHGVAQALNPEPNGRPAPPNE